MVKSAYIPTDAASDASQHHEPRRSPAVAAEAVAVSWLGLQDQDYLSLVVQLQNDAGDTAGLVTAFTSRQNG